MKPQVGASAPQTRGHIPHKGSSTGAPPSPRISDLIRCRNRITRLRSPAMQACLPNVYRELGEIGETMFDLWYELAGFNKKRKPSRNDMQL